MIILEALNNNPSSGSGIACNIGATIINTSTPIQDLVDFCICDYECLYEEKVFVNLSDTSNKFENDKKDLLVRLPDVNGLVEFFLVKDGNEIQLNDDTYGTYYTIGFNSENNDKTGFVVDWVKVVQSLGHGIYNLRTKINSFGSDSVIDSIRYRTYNYSDENANGTFVIRTTHNGYIENGLDYTGLNWERYIRMNGSLKGFNPVPEHTRYNNTSRISKQIQTSVTTDYSLKARMIPQQVFESLFYDRLLANDIYISDYNVFNPLQKVRDLRVEWDENNSIDEFPKNTKINVDIKVRNIDNGTLKRQYR